MAAVISASNVEASYEDMFKEITRKLYGEETGNGLHTLGTPVAQVATTGPTAPEGERSFTNLVSQKSKKKVYLFLSYFSFFVSFCCLANRSLFSSHH